MRQRDVTLVVHDLDITPDDLASQLGISPKRLRAWLRLSRPRSPAEHGARWNIDGSTIEAARVHFFSTGSEAIRTPRSDRSSPHRTRDHSDEAYVIDLCDEILGEHGNRLVIIRPGHLDSDTRGRLRRRDRERDLAAMRRMLDV